MNWHRIAGLSRRVDREVEFIPQKDALFDGLAFSYEIELTPARSVSVSPWEKTIEGVNAWFLPFEEPCRVRAGIPVRVHLVIESSLRIWQATIITDNVSKAADEQKCDGLCSSASIWTDRQYRLKLTHALLHLLRDGVPPTRILPALTRELGVSSVSERRTLRQHVPWILSKGLVRTETDHASRK